MAMAKKNVFRALTNEKDIFNKKLKIQSELLMRNKIQCCWSIPLGDLTFQKAKQIFRNK